MPRRSTAAAALLLTLAGSCLLTACTPYARYPRVEGDTAVEDLNVLPSPIVMRLALQRVASRHLQGARPYAIDVPDLVSDDTVADMLGNMPEDVQVAWEADASVPVIAVTRVWVLGDTAVVDVTRPVPAAGARQTLTVRLRSDIRGWRVVGVRSWPVGLDFTEPSASDLEYEDAPFEEFPADAEAMDGADA